MTPRVLFIGGEKGSWEVRGRQVGNALHGRITVRPNRNDWAWADVVVLVKRAMDQWGADAKRTGLPLIWDALDFWEQPEDNQWTPEQHRTRVIARLSRVSVTLGATRAMAEDIGGLYMPHHSRPGLAPRPPRKALGVVAYEGRVKYLGQWNGLLQQACERLGARFVINPPSLSDADVVVAFRGEPWDGWACRQWKSGVKYVNAVVAGRPVVTQPCAGFHEIAPVGRAVDEPQYLDMAIREAWALREQAYDTGRRRAAEFSLESIAKQYRRLFQSVLRKAA